MYRYPSIMFRVAAYLRNVMIPALITYCYQLTIIPILLSYGDMSEMAGSYPRSHRGDHTSDSSVARAPRWCSEASADR
jgi:hypothetical protein